MGLRIEPYKGIAGIYEEIRPSYPERLIEDVVDRAKLKAGDSLLELGAGTGKATAQFSHRGFSIKAIEIGEEMAEILRDKCGGDPDISVEVTSFENWENKTFTNYDLIYSAQAFHWLDPQLKYKKCHTLLKDRGFLALFWYTPCSDLSERSKRIQEKADGIVSQYVKDYCRDPEKPERPQHDGVVSQDQRAAEIEASGLFELVEQLDYIEEIQNDAEQYLKAMKSVPAFATVLDGLDSEKIAQMDHEITELIEKDGGTVGTRFHYSLYIARKTR